MKKTAQVLFNVACIISCTVGVLHFFAPYFFRWYSYIPDAPLEIYQSINYVNFCFSFLLAGFSLVLLFVQKQLFSGTKELRLFYAFFVLVWLSRVVIQIVWPWPSSLQIWLVIAFTIELLLTSVPMVYFLQNARRH
jgi:hypothetical protein